MRNLIREVCSASLFVRFGLAFFASQPLSRRAPRAFGAPRGRGSTGDGGKHGTSGAVAQGCLARRSAAFIIRAMTAPGTARPWHDSATTVVRVVSRQGRAFWAENTAALERARRVRRAGGNHRRDDRHRTCMAATSATSKSRRAGNARFRLPAACGFLPHGARRVPAPRPRVGFDAAAWRGSYAARSHPAILPTATANTRSISTATATRSRGERADAIGSVANYYRSFGWKRQRAWSYPWIQATPSLRPCSQRASAPHHGPICASPRTARARRSTTLRSDALLDRDRNPDRSSCSLTTSTSSPATTARSIPMAVHELATEIKASFRGRDKEGRLRRKPGFPSVRLSQRGAGDS